MTTAKCPHCQRNEFEIGEARLSFGNGEIPVLLCSHCKAPISIDYTKQLEKIIDALKK